MLVVFNKPYGVLSQFTPDVEGQRTLADFGFPPKVYPIGRLDLDSEGMLLLSDEGVLNKTLLDPRQAHWRRYCVQIEGNANAPALAAMQNGLIIRGRMTRPAHVWMLDQEPDFPPRDPPIRFRKRIPTSWLVIELHEGRNRQVRRMTASVGLPTLRLIRTGMGSFDLPVHLAAGGWREVSPAEKRAIFAQE
jgi:23S rRNA pseudouridine2457 synthase